MDQRSPELGVLELPSPVQQNAVAVRFRRPAHLQERPEIVNWTVRLFASLAKARRRRFFSWQRGNPSTGADQAQAHDVIGFGREHERTTPVSDRGSAPMIARSRIAAALDAARRSVNAHTIS